MRHKIVHKPVIRYLLAGGSSYVLELVCLLSLNKLVGLSAGTATAIAFWIGLSSSFWLQKIFAFKDYKKTSKAIANQLTGYALLVGFNYLFTLVVVTKFPPSALIFSRTIALVATTTWNFALYKVIFHDNPKAALKTHGQNTQDTIARLRVALVSQRARLIFGGAVTLPIVIFFYQYLATPHKFIVGDFDYYSQMYEAARISVLKFHQFPLWNPWLSGGIPLFSNPQFGLFSLQFILVLFFGGLYGLKLAYVSYAILGFWGMYAVGRNVLSTSKLRAVLIGYIWVFCGFYAGHTVSHLTFTSFFLLPWLLYFISLRNKRYSWLWLGVVESVIILSSVHYAFLMTSLILVIFFCFSLSRIEINKNGLKFNFQIMRKDVFFSLKALSTVAVLAGYQFYNTYKFVSHNERLINVSSELPPTLGVIFKSLFFPIGTILDYPKTTWGWGEYSMYIGAGTGIALLICLGSATQFLTRRKGKNLIHNLGFVICAVLIGIIGFLFALGNFGSLSPFHILHILPGFTQTRVPSRWLIFSVFSILVFLMAWKKNTKLVNTLLALGVFELFISFGPPHITGKNQITMPDAVFSSSFSQYDNGLLHLDADQNIMHSYYYTTSRNIGQIYADDSLINTLSSDLALHTRRCAQNTKPDCSFIMTHNAVVTYWSPNRIKIERTDEGPIELNMNVDAGWKVNDLFPFIQIKNIDPSRQFVLPSGEKNYTLEYAPKFSPTWVYWRARKIL